MPDVLKILMVEPFPIVRQVLEEQMEAMDFALTEATSTEHAKSLIQASFDLVLFHITQADEPHEWAELRELKACEPTVPLVFWSNNPDDEQLVKKVGIGTFMHVPFSPHFITQSLCSMVKRPGMQFRASKRIHCNLKAEVKVAGGQGIGSHQILDVSSSGLLLAAASELPMQTRLEIEVLRGNKSFRLIGDIVSARQAKDGRHLYGISFDDDAPARKLMAQLKS